MALNSAPLARFISFFGLFIMQSNLFPFLSAWYISTPTLCVQYVIISDLICRLGVQSVTKPVRESLWVLIPKDSKYRAKIIIDVFAHRVGTSTAAFLANLPILAIINNFLLNSNMIQEMINTLRVYTKYGDGSSRTVLLGNDHIIWGLCAASLYWIASTKLGIAFKEAKKKV